jgi:integrase
VNEFLAYKRERGRKESTVTTIRHRLVAFLRLAELDRPFSSLTAARARELYALRCGETKPDTHRAELAQAGSFAKWCVKQGYLLANPFAVVEPVGRRSSGKPQLRLDEARTWLRVAQATPGESAVAATLALLTGARAAEVTDRLVRDLDDGGRLLWITESKTKAGVRQVPVPEQVRGRLLALAAGRAPDERLFAINRHQLRTAVRTICKRAGVPVVSPHGLRGTFATLAVLDGNVTDRVAATLGQDSAGVTRRSYMAPGTEARAAVDRVLGRLEGKPENAAQVPRSPDDDGSSWN